MIVRRHNVFESTKKIMALLDPKCFKLALKGEQLKRVATKFPGIDHRAVRLITSLDYVVRQSRESFDRILGNIGVSEGRFYVLTYITLENLEGNMDVRPSDIADNVGVTRATITGLLDNLERDGYIERHQPHHDRRTQIVFLTPKAENFLRDITDELGKNLNPITELLTDQEYEEFIRITDKIEQHWVARL